MEDNTVITSLEDFDEFKQVVPTKKHSDYYTPVVEYSLEGVYLNNFESASDASREFNIPLSTITRCCYGDMEHGRNILTTRNMIFLWVGDSISERLEQIKQRKKK